MCNLNEAPDSSCKSQNLRTRSTSDFFELTNQLGDYFIHIAYDAIVGHLEHWGFLVLVDGNNGLGILSTGNMLYLTGNACAPEADSTARCQAPATAKLPPLRRRLGPRLPGGIQRGARTPPLDGVEEDY